MTILRVNKKVLSRRNNKDVYGLLHKWGRVSLITLNDPHLSFHKRAGRSSRILEKVRNIHTSPHMDERNWNSVEYSREFKRTLIYIICAKISREFYICKKPLRVLESSREFSYAINRWWPVPHLVQTPSS